MIGISTVHMRNSRLKHHCVALMVAAALFVGPAAPANAINSDIKLPDLGDPSTAVFSPAEAHDLGRAWLMAFRNQAPIVTDPLLTDYLEHLLYRLAMHSQLQDRRLELVIIDNKTMNAFAVPGGVIGVHNGLFLYADNEDELASVLAHELGHLSQHHFERNVERQKEALLPTMAGLLGSLIIAATAGGDAGMAAITATQAASVQNQLRYSRENEREADRSGIETLENAGFNPEAMANMFESLQRESRLYGRQPPEFLLTHPVTESRIADARSRAARMPHQKSSDPLEFELMKARVEFHFEPNTNAAIKRFRADLDNGDHPFAQRYALVLAYTQAGQFDAAQKQMDILIKKDPDRIPFVVTQARLWLAAGKITEARDLLAHQLQYNPGNHPLTMAYADALLRNGQPKKAETLLEAHVKERPDDPDVWYQLAEVHGLAGNIVGVHQARAEYFVLMGAPDQAIRQLGYALPLVKTNYAATARIKERIRQIEALKKKLRME